MIFSNEQRLELAKMLESDTFRRARDIVLDKTDNTVAGQLAPEAGLQMAAEKGVRAAFKELVKLSLPIAVSPVSSPVARSVHTVAKKNKSPDK